MSVVQTKLELKVRGTKPYKRENRENKADWRASKQLQQSHTPLQLYTTANNPNNTKESL